MVPFEISSLCMFVLFSFCLQHAQEIGKEDELRLRRSKKLVLLVDLDQTLIHTTTVNVPNKLKVFSPMLCSHTG